MRTKRHSSSLYVSRSNLKGGQGSRVVVITTRTDQCLPKACESNVLRGFGLKGSRDGGGREESVVEASVPLSPSAIPPDYKGQGHLTVTLKGPQTCLR